MPGANRDSVVGDGDENGIDRVGGCFEDFETKGGGANTSSVINCRSRACHSSNIYPKFGGLLKNTNTVALEAWNYATRTKALYALRLRTFFAISSASFSYSLPSLMSFLRIVPTPIRINS